MERKAIREQDVLVLANMAYRLESVDDLLKKEINQPLRSILVSFRDFQQASKKAIDEDLRSRGLTPKVLLGEQEVRANGQETL